MSKLKLQRKIFIYLLIVFVLFTATALRQFCQPAYAAEDSSTSDYDNSWAKDVISHYIQRGVIIPDKDGNVEPRKAMTRVEVAILINKALNFTKTAEISYTDVTSADSFYKDLQIAKGMGYMIGGGDKQPFRPNAPITRQEMSILVSRILELQLNIEAAKIFADFDKIPTDEAKGAIGAMADPTVKVLEGIGNGLFDPNADITRDQAYTMIYRAEKIYLELQSGKRQYLSVDIIQKETFGNLSITKNYHDVNVYSQDVILQNIVIWGDLSIHRNISGNVALNNVTVKGNTYIYGGDLIKIDNSKLNILTVDKDNNTIYLDFSGTSSVSKIFANSGLFINAPAMTIPNIIISETEKSAIVSIKGLLIENLEVQSRAYVNIMDGIVQDLLIGHSASDTVVFVEQSAHIIDAVVNCAAAIRGKGTVISVILNTDKAVISTEHTKITDNRGNINTNNGKDDKKDTSTQNTTSTATNATNNSNNTPNYPSYPLEMPNFQLPQLPVPSNPTTGQQNNTNNQNNQNNTNNQNTQNTQNNTNNQNNTNTNTPTEYKKPEETGIPAPNPQPIPQPTTTSKLNIKDFDDVEPKVRDSKTIDLLFMKDFGNLTTVFFISDEIQVTNAKYEEYYDEDGIITGKYVLTLSKPLERGKSYILLITVERQTKRIPIGLD